MISKLLIKEIALGIIIMFILSCFFPIISGHVEDIPDDPFDLNSPYIRSVINESVVDIEYIYNITKALSYIIFTEYDESAGEIAKGRAFGTKGEWRAAEILYDNMTKLGLFTIKEQIKNLPKPSCTNLEHKLEVLDYELKLNGEVIECAPCTPPMGPTGKPFKIDHNFSYKGLKIRREHPKFWESKEDYVLFKGFDKTGQYPPPNPDATVTYSGLQAVFKAYKKRINKTIDHILHPRCKATVVMDYFNNTFDQCARGVVGNAIPVFWINGSIGRKIDKNIDDFTVDFFLNQKLNHSVISYNVIGQLNGTDPTKTVIVDGLYDGWWTQATADGAMGMACVLGIAKYFTDHNITPKYNLKFIGFGGEEYGMRGSYYYEAAHRDENIINVVDFNQIGMTQKEPRLRLEVVTNTPEFKDEIWEVVNRTDYIGRTDNVTNIVPSYLRVGHISDDRPFAMRRPFRVKTVCLLKGGRWVLHHRDGVNHQEGDVLKYFNWTDVSVTGEIALNITKHLAVDPSDQFTAWDYSVVDSDSNGYDDTIKTNFNLTTDFSDDYVTIKAQLYKDNKRSKLVDQSQVSFLARKGSDNTGELTVSVPKDAKAGWYYLKLLLVDSSGEIDHIKTSSLMYLYPIN